MCSKKKDQLSVSFYRTQRAIEWERFIHMPLRSITEEPDEIELRDWVRALLYDGIFVAMDQNGYNLGINPHQVANDFMNYLFHFKAAWNNGRPCKFIGAFAADNYRNLTLEDEEFFFKRFDTNFWENMRRSFAIELFADESDFAQVLWENIPIIIFEMVNRNTSNAVLEMEEFLSYMNDVDSGYVYDEAVTAVAKTREIDPYIQDYWTK